jgi:hypothetical protein
MYYTVQTCMHLLHLHLLLLMVAVSLLLLCLLPRDNSNNPNPIIHNPCFLSLSNNAVVAFLPPSLSLSLSPSLSPPLFLGKSELIRALVEGYPRHFSYSVSHTTRPRREDEKDGVQYWFCSEDQMKLQIDKGRYFEHVSAVQCSGAVQYRF